MMGHLLDHIKNGFVFVEPDIMVGDGHGLECDTLGILEEGVRSPDLCQPLHR